MVLPIKVYVIAASLATIVYLAILFRHAIAKASDTVCAMSPTKKCALAVMLLIAVVFGGGKTNTQDNVDGGLTNLLTGAFRSLAHLIDSADDLRHPPVTDEDLAFGWQPIGPFTNASLSYSMPNGAALATNWWLRGAFEDVIPVSNLWAYTWGKVRFALADTNEIVAVGAPMSAVPYHSRLWSVADTNGSRLVTWENFVLGRAPAADYQLPSTNYQLVSTQIEFRPNGDYVTRSNELETVWRHIDPNDFDGDGYLNGDDPNPYEWDDGADTYYGPYNDLPWDCNEDAYCDVTVEIDGTQSEWVTFTGDGYSDYSDPFFLAKPGIPYDVKILIGKTYRITCVAPVRAVGKSDDEIAVSDVATNAFTVVWPVTITEAPRLFAAPPPGLLGGSHGNTGFTLDVDPYWLDGVFDWTTNTCCQIVDNGGWWEFACDYDCKCGGCEIGGSYTYEGYTVFFSDISCGCHYTPHDDTTFDLTAPSVVFKDGALRPLEIAFHHGDTIDPEEGELTLEVIRGNDKIRLWEDPDKACETTSPRWYVSGFDGCTIYIEGLEKSQHADDIKFRLTWTRPGGSSSHADATTTCAEVKETQVTSPTAGITDGSSNPQPFDGHTAWNFNVTHSPHPDKHFAVLFRDVVNDDFSVRDFSVRMTLVVEPSDAPVGTASWFALEPTPASGAIVSTDTCVGELRNPKVGGVYHIGSCFDGSPTNECNIVLPLAGAEMINVLHGDIARADSFLTAAKRKYTYDERTSYKFGWRWFYSHENGDYTGRPENGQTPSVWYYGQVEPYSGMGNVCTLAGTPTKLAKLSNLLTAYCCEKLQVSPFKQALSQLLGKFNGSSATISWECGQNIANGTNFYFAVSNMARQAWREMDNRVTKPWPNVLPAVNWHEKTTYLGINRNVYSPAFLNHTP